MSAAVAASLAHIFTGSIHAYFSFRRQRTMQSTLPHHVFWIHFDEYLLFQRPSRPRCHKNRYTPHIPVPLFQHFAVQSATPMQIE